MLARNGSDDTKWEAASARVARQRASFNKELLIVSTFLKYRRYLNDVDLLKLSPFLGSSSRKQPSGKQIVLILNLSNWASIVLVTDPGNFLRFGFGNQLRTLSVGFLRAIAVT